MKKVRKSRGFLFLFIVGVVIITLFFGLSRGGLAGPQPTRTTGDAAGQETVMLDTVLNYLPMIFRAWSPEEEARESLVISEVMYDPLETEPGGEWIEIFNPGLRSVDLAEFKVGDEEMIGGSEGMLGFPEGVILQSQDAIVIANQAVPFQAQYGFWPDFEMRISHPDVPTLIPYAAWAGGNVVLLNTSDEVLLLNENDDLVDAVSWGSSVFAFDPPAPDVPAGSSLERAPASSDHDQAADWRAQASPRPGEVDLRHPTATPTSTGYPTATAPSETLTPTSTEGPSPTPSLTPTPFQGMLLISEVQYDPSQPEPAAEWIEIFNPGVEDLSLVGFKIGDEESIGGGEGMAAFPSGAGISAGQTILVAREAQAFLESFGFLPDYEFSDSDPVVQDMEPYPNWASGSISLGNTGDEVLLLDPGDRLVDAISWGSSSFAFDPPAPDVAEGHSLERTPANQDADSAADWVDQAAPAPGSVQLDAPTATPSPEPPTETPTPTLSPTPTATLSVTLTATPTPGLDVHLLISEIFYDTPGTDSQEEWVEIFNPSEAPVQLAGYKIGDEETAGGSEGMYEFPDGSQIGSWEKLIVALDGVGFFAEFGFYPNFEISDSDPGVPDMVPYDSWGSGLVGLSNSGDEVLLLDPANQPIDVVVYENGVFPGVVPHSGVGTGHSLARSPSGQDTDDCSLDFIDLEVPTPGG